MRAAMADSVRSVPARDDEVAVYERNAGVVDPEAAIRALHGQALAGGAELRFETSIDGWESAATV